MIQIPQHGNGQHNRHYKTNICRHFEIGNCSIGKKCQFAHGQFELRKPNDPLPTDVPQIEPNLVITNFKTVLCKYHLIGFCKNGTNCSYAHGLTDRKQARLATLPNQQEIQDLEKTSFNTLIENQEIHMNYIINYFLDQLENLIPNLTAYDKTMIIKSRELCQNSLYEEATQMIVKLLQISQRSEEDRYIYQSVYRNALLQYQDMVSLK